MLEYSIMKPEGFLLLKPTALLSRADFVGLTRLVDAYLADNTTIHGVLIHAETFPGWDSFAGFSAHMQFVRNHHQKIERIALVTDSAVAGVAEALGKHFIAAEFRRFPFAEYDSALNWLKMSIPGSKAPEIHAAS